MKKHTTKATDYDYVIVGSGFGGSVSALRLSQKGYKVLVIEKGRWYKDSTYAHSAWDLKRWLWMPLLGLRGIMKMTVLKHITVYSGVGVGGGSHTYGATLPTPKKAFFNTGSWANLQNWEEVLKPYYKEALRMLGAQDNPNFTQADIVIKELAQDLGKEDEFHPSRVAIFFSDKKDHGSFVKDPYFDGEGPERRGCIECGSCFTGCRFNAKNTLDKNYLYLAQKLGAEIVAEQEVHDIYPAGKKDGSEGYFVSFKSSKPYSFKKNHVVRAKGVIFSGGVLGTVPLLLKLKEKGSLAGLSDKVGDDIRTNNETISTVTSFKEDINFAQGVSIGSVLHTDDHSHLEPINYNAQSTVVKFLHAPNVVGRTILSRAASFVKLMVTEPKENLKVLFTKDWSKKSIILLFMQHLDSTLSLKRGLGGRLTSNLGQGPAPSRYIKESTAITEKIEKIVDGKSSTGITEAVFGTPSTAHILGGSVMAASTEEGVINDKAEVFGYHNMYVCDGSAISANPGVNPSLSITALSEWAMSHVPDKNSEEKDSA
ncbi:GMC oxidoreductase [Thalassotalea euphylliae]|uniref:Cholesterol oxidase n=1 Tax=Thalassotalea euphylliae TaxID=1655234 RepID=A0A3E0U2N4_9GAMM|nr:GMC oxidoreductase [Thalassotalea euphylliae]REL30823.1 GMC family oxidoreductase [Thalassotalea euphylliae]